MNIETVFKENGGVFCTPFDTFKEKLNHIKAFVFDWDGVFNSGVKDERGSSDFNEVDASGTNLLRFSRWLEKKTMPITVVMSGETNHRSFQYAQREHFQQAYFKVNFKQRAFAHFLEVNNLKAEEVAFLFDDVLDLAIAKQAGIRILIQRKANPLFTDYVVRNMLTDYITGQSSGQFAVREACELMIGTTGNYDTVVHERLSFSATYQTYLAERQAMETLYYTLKDGAIVQTPTPS